MKLMVAKTDLHISQFMSSCPLKENSFVKSFVLLKQRRPAVPIYILQIISSFICVHCSSSTGGKRVKFIILTFIF